ncbi:XkdF-like putative serine protease domain-containing protein [Dysgonomonas sp. 25]|uniref:XkdF-like putative serine protease domain-containing protein n=1 Tax=Dysgonomonas sp. 25 TaxID=2302933 RepID=UPI0013D631BE|nr:XkdF-like putative serine protease domain-containing protein [Dysgonomonas sp. 25]NDV69282.1 hypothetical protein [Dysgonomonas sp. 25]
MKLPVYNCLIDENLEDETGIYAISFVDCPANEVDFVALSQQMQPLHLNRDEQKQVLTGVVLKPDQLIYRNSPTMGEHYIRFSAEQIRKIAQKMMRTGIALTTTTHQHAQPLQGNYLTELWIVEDPERDKSRALGFDDLPQGTLMCSYKIEDRNYWDEQVMAGHVKGFSLEGLFNQEIALNKHQINSKNKKRKMNNRKQKKTLLRRIAHLLLGIEDVKKRDTTDSGEPFIIFILADGKEVYVDQDGFATMDEEQMPAGEHKLANGNLLVIDEKGDLVETRPAADAISNPDSQSAPEALRRYYRQLAEQPLDDEPEEAQPADPKGKSELLKAKIAEMQKAIDELSAALEEASKQVETLRRQTPSARPAVQRQSAADQLSMSTAERMAVALNETLQRRK